MARLVRCNRGTTTPEYAILALAIIAAIIPAIGSVGNLVSQTFSEVGLGPEVTIVSPSKTTPRTTVSSPSAANSGDFLSWTRWINTLSLVVVPIALAWLLLRKKPPKETVPRPLAKDLPATSGQNDIEKRQQIAKRLYSDKDALLQGDLEVRHLMTISPVTVGPKATVQQAREIMDKHQLDYLLVCTSNGKLHGLLSSYYLQRTTTKRVSDAMLPNPLFVGPDALLSPTVTQMLNKGVSCVAVVDQDQAIGMVTTTDIQLTFQAALQVLAKATSERQPVQSDPTVIV